MAKLMGNPVKVELSEEIAEKLWCLQKQNPEKTFDEIGNEILKMGIACLNADPELFQLEIN